MAYWMQCSTLNGFRHHGLSPDEEQIQMLYIIVLLVQLVGNNYLFIKCLQ